MIKDAIKYLQDTLISPKDRLVNFKDVDYVDRQFLIDNDGQAREVKPVDMNAVHPLHVKTLTSLISYIKRDEERPTPFFFLHVEDERTVTLWSALDFQGVREHLITANAIVPNFDYEYFHDAEELIIALQSTFTKTGDRDLLLKVIGNIKEENVRNTGDTGFSQAVTIQTGVASADDVKVPNPVTLAPYRTFLEVEQPSSEFIFRMKDGPRGAIFEADGGAWRNAAIANVRDYLSKELKEEVSSGRITIIA